MTEPHIIRTAAEFLDLPSVAVLLTRGGKLTRARDILPLVDLPAVVVTNLVIPNREQVRDAHTALQEAIDE